MNLYTFDKTYSKNSADEVRIILDDGEKSLPIRIKIYVISDFVYADIMQDDGTPLLTGHLIRAFNDVLDFVHSRFYSFPQVGIVALPLSVNSFNLEFNFESAGKDMDLMVIDYE